jgi:uncharacterized membrane protein
LIISSADLEWSQGWGSVSLKSEYKTIDGLKFFQEIYPNEYDAITWINNNIANQQILLTSSGDPYTKQLFVSTYTGLPTILGSALHEKVWRNTEPEIEKREKDIDDLYLNKNTKELLKKYDIKYVFVGELEKLKYPDNDFKHFDEFGQIIYSNSAAKIYKINKL